MKKLSLLIVLVIFSGFAFSQTLEKGNLIGLHSITIKPNPDVTLNQFMDYFMNTWVPRFEESFPGVKLYVIKGNRGENENSFGLIMFFNSVEDRDKYWPKVGEPSELGQQGFEKLGPTLEEFQKLVS